MAEWKVGDIVMIRKDLDRYRKYLFCEYEHLERFAGQRCVVKERWSGADSTTYTLQSCDTGEYIGLMFRGHIFPVFWQGILLVEPNPEIVEISQDELFCLLAAPSSA